jgi:hypothetical protein
MKLTQIETTKGNIRARIEENIKTGDYSIDIDLFNEDGTHDSNIVSFRTDEVIIEDVIEILTFFKNYNFIQE